MSENVNKFDADAMIKATQNLHQEVTNKQTTGKKSTFVKTDLSNYFNLQGLIPKGQTTGEVTVRILPSNEGEVSPFVVKKYHSLKVGGNYRKFYDPEQDGEVSPLNVMGKIVFDAAETKEERKQGAKFISNDFYICRLIQRGKEEDGPKFFRFKASHNGDGVMNKIEPLLSRGFNPFDPGPNGVDLTFILGKSGNGGTIINNVMTEKPAPLSDNEITAAQWIENTMKWSDVYKKYPTDYLEILAKDGEPVWDKENKCFMDKGEVSSQSTSTTSFGRTQQEPEKPTENSVQETIEEKGQIVEPEYTSNVSDDDLPF